MIRYINDLFRYRELIELLTAREIKVRYKQSFLGIFWALFQPLVMVILFTAIFTKIVRMPVGNVPYPVFILTGLIPWTFFANSLNAAIPSIVMNGDLVKKIYFPRVIFPIASILAAFFDFLIASFLVVAVILFFKMKISISLIFLPIVVFIQIFFTVGVSLILSALNVHYRDVKNALASLIQIWMFATPVIYPLEVIRPHLRQILLLNPMSGVLDAYRKILVEGIWPDFNYLAYSIVITTIVFIIAYLFFKKMEPTFSDDV